MLHNASATFTNSRGGTRVGDVFRAVDLVSMDGAIAVKVEKASTKKPVLAYEVSVLKKLSGTCPQACELLFCGKTDDCNFVVMTLLGENLSTLRKQQPETKFSLATTLLVCRQMLTAIRGVHQVGYLHRDIKPSNFVMGVGNKRRTVFIVDFGLARRYLEPDGSIRAERRKAGFRGTSRYASLNAHTHKDMSRRDDLWSWYYLIVEFLRGKLPWRQLKDKDAIYDMKVSYGPSKLLEGLPSFLHSIYNSLQKLSYLDEPDYDALMAILDRELIRRGISSDCPYDWEVDALMKVAAETQSMANNEGIMPNNKDYSEPTSNRHSSACRMLVSETDPRDQGDLPAELKTSMKGGGSSSGGRGKGGSGSGGGASFARTDDLGVSTLRRTVPGAVNSTQAARLNGGGGLHHSGGSSSPTPQQHDGVRGKRSPIFVNADRDYPSRGGMHSPLGGIPASPTSPTSMNSPATGTKSSNLPSNISFGMLSSSHTLGGGVAGGSGSAEKCPRPPTGPRPPAVLRGSTRFTVHATSSTHPGNVVASADLFRNKHEDVFPQQGRLNTHHVSKGGKSRK